MAAEDAILLGNKRIAEELQKVPKAKGGGQLGKGGNRTQAKSNVGKADTGIKKDTRSRLGGYVRMAVAERREAVKELTGEGLSQREIHDVTGMGLGSVNRALHSVPNGTTVGEDVQENEGATVPDGTPLDALAVLAADDAVQKQIKVEAEKAEKEAAREAARPGLEFRPRANFLSAFRCGPVAAGKKFSVIVTSRTPKLSASEEAVARLARP